MCAEGIGSTIGRKLGISRDGGSLGLGIGRRLLPGPGDAVVVLGKFGAKECKAEKVKHTQYWQ